MNRLALDMSRGEGESLSALASLVGVNSSDMGTFSSTVRSNYGRIFSSPSVSSVEVTAQLREVLAADAQLAKYSVNV